MLLREFIRDWGERAHGLNAGAAWSLYRGLRDLEQLRERGFERVKAGPGGGVRVGPFVASYLLVGAMAGASRHAAPALAWDAWHLVGTCSGTRQSVFGDALNSILAHPETAEVVRDVTLFRTPTLQGRIRWVGAADSNFVADSTAAEMAECSGAFRTAAILGGPTLASMALALWVPVQVGRPAGQSHRDAPRDAGQRASSQREPASPPPPFHWPLAGRSK